jgi:CHAT domain-containing protein
MTGAAVWLLCALQIAAPSGAERLRALARDGPQAVLVARVRAQPDDVRDALRQLLAASPPLAPAESLAAAYVVAWHDSFLVRQVVRFRSYTTDQRRAKVAADSLRRAGNDALGRSGVDAALRLWRESVRRAAAIGDTAAMAAGWGNIGRAFYDAHELDSAEAYWIRSRDFALSTGDARTAGNAIGNLASARRDRGDLRQADSLFARAGEIRVRSGDARGLAADENNRALIAQTLGDVAGARRAFGAALAANRGADRRGPAAVNLINLGNLDVLVGDVDAAARRYSEALDLSRAAGDRPQTAEVWHDIGLLRLSRGDYPGAKVALAAALAIYRRTGPVGDAAAVQRDLAEVRAAAGDVEGALQELRRAETAVGTSRDDAQIQGSLALARADLALALNRPEEADRAFTQAQQAYRRVPDPSGEADALQGRAYLLLLREDFPQARDVLEQVLRAQETAGPRSRALTRLLVGYALREGGDTAGARDALTAACDTLRLVGDAAGEAAALGELADLAERAGIGFTAESLYRRGLARLGGAPAPSVSWPLHAGLARALGGRNALTEAVTEWHAAAADVEQVAARLPLEQRRAAYLADKWDVYAQLALTERARGRIDAAFEASERLRARQLLDLLARGRIAWAAPLGDSLALREQDLRLRISDLTRRLEQSPVPNEGLREPRAAATDAVREALSRTQAAYGDLLARVQESKPEYAHLVRGEVVPMREVARRLGADEALLEYLVTDSTTLVFVVTSDTAVLLDLGVGRRALAALVDFTRGALSRPARGSFSGGPSWRAPLGRLHQLLIEPIEATGLLAGKRALVIVPHAELHYLPFAALLKAGAGQPFLVERYVVAVAPSASVWLRLGGRIDSRPGTGALALAPRVDALPASREEVNAIGRAFGSRTRVLIGARATKRVLRAVASTQGIIHFATYGVLNKHNPLFSFVELAAQPGEDGRLEVHDVFALDLHARLVVLSACQTALGSGVLADVPAGDDWVGLVEGFLYAGAAHVLATLWPVEDRATANLMERFYGAVAAGRPEAEALAVAQRQALRNSATADPFYWAGFTLSGGL